MRIDIPQAVNAQYAVDTRDPNIGMKQVIQGLGAVSQAYDIYETSVATNNLAQHEQKLSAIENELTASDRIDLNNPVIPEDVRKKVTESPDYKQRATTIEDGRTFIPTSMVMTDVMNDYKNKAFALADESIGGSKREQYKAALAGTFQKADEKIGKAQHAYVATEIQGNYLNAADAFAKNGNYDLATKSIHEAVGVGVLDRNAGESQIDSINKTFQLRTEGQVSVLTNKASQAALSGNREGMDAYTAQIDTQLQQGIQAGYLTPEKANEMSLVARTKGEIQLASGNITRTYQSGGIDAAVGYAMGVRDQVPDGVDPEKWQSAISSEISQLNSLHNMTTGGREGAKAAAKLQEKRTLGRSYAANQTAVIAGSEQADNAEKYHEEALASMDLSTPQGQREAVDFLTVYMNETGYLSKAGTQTLQALAQSAQSMADSGNPDGDAIAEQLAYITRQMQNKKGITAQTEKFLQDNPYMATASYLVGAGVPVKNLNKAVSDMVNVPKDVVETRKTYTKQSRGDFKAWNKTIKSSIGGEIADYMDKVSPVAYAGMINDYENYYDAMYIITGDSGVASGMAAKHINHVYEMTKTPSGIKPVKNGINSFKEVAGAPDWGKKQLDEQAFKASPQVVGRVGLKNIFYKTDNETGEGGQDKGFILQAREDEYSPPYNVLDENGSIIRLKPNIEQVPKVIQQKKAAQDALDAERQTSDYQVAVKGKMLEAYKPVLDKLATMTGNSKDTLIWGMAEVDRIAEEEIGLLPKTVKGSRGTMVVDQKKVDVIKKIASEEKAKLKEQRTMRRIGIDENEKPVEKPAPTNRGGGRYPNNPSNSGGRGYSPL